MDKTEKTEKTASARFGPDVRTEKTEDSMESGLRSVLRSRLAVSDEERNQ